jgi:hypothetical protein
VPGKVLYTGELKAGYIKHDKNAKLEYSNGWTYQGEFKDDYKEGFGVMIGPNQEKFEG